MLKKILENLSMAKKKTAKKAAAKKTEKKAVKKTATKKAPAKKTGKKVAAKKAATKKVVAKKAVKKTTAKKVAAKKTTAKKAEPKKKVAAKSKSAAKVAKKTAKKVTKKVLEAKAPKVTAKKAKQEKAKPEPKKAKTKKNDEDELLEELVEKVIDEDDDDDDLNKKSSGSLGFDDDFSFEDDDFQLSAKEEKRLITDVKEVLADQIVDLAEDFSLNEIFTTIRSMEFFETDNDECLERGCDNPATSGAFCRFHYIKNWKDIKKKQALLQEGKLQAYIEEIVKKYPAKYIENILSDLVDEKSFFGVLKELNIDGLDEYDETGDDDDGDEDIAFETKTTKGFDED